jgi:hypothetical protein
MPEETLLAFTDHGNVNDVLPVDGGDAEGLASTTDVKEKP